MPQHSRVLAMDHASYKHLINHQKSCLGFIFFLTKFCQFVTIFADIIRMEETNVRTFFSFWGCFPYYTDLQSEWSDNGPRVLSLYLELSCLPNFICTILDWTSWVRCATNVQIWPLAFFPNLVIRWQHWPPGCVTWTFWHFQLVLSLYLHQPESHQTSFNKVT